MQTTNRLGIQDKAETTYEARVSHTELQIQVNCRAIAQKKKFVTE